MDSETKQFFQRLVNSEPENKVCIDCSAPHPQWASLSYGTYFCLNCSGTHRSLGVHLSFVRSISMDTWSEKQKKAMECGGNAAFKKFAQEQGIDGFRIQDKYNTVAAEYYRNMLKAKCAGEPLPALPPAGTGKNLNNGQTVRKPMVGMGSGMGSASNSCSPPRSFTSEPSNQSYGLSYQGGNNSQPYRPTGGGNDLFSEWTASAGGFFAQAQQAATVAAATATAKFEETKNKAAQEGWFDFDNLQSQASQWANKAESAFVGGNKGDLGFGNGSYNQAPPILVEHRTSNVSGNGGISSITASPAPSPAPSRMSSAQSSVSRPENTPEKKKTAADIFFREQSPARVDRKTANISLTPPDLSKSSSNNKKVDVWDTNAWFDEM